VFKITCYRGHKWTANFRAKQGRRWCRICPIINRVERREAAEARMAVENDRIEREQNEMFE
jgi:hypothetical protein